VSSGLAAYPSIYFDRVAVSTLQANLVLYDGIEKKIMPDRQGVVIQLFDHSKMAANTTPVTEGTPFAGQAVVQNVRSITLSQFADYISISDKVDRTQLIDQGTANAELLGYRGALSVDTVIANSIETARAADAATQIDVAHLSFLTTAKIRQARFSLGGLDIQPKANGLYFGVTHPLTAFDLVNENTAGSFMDLQKYTKDMSGQGVKNNRIGVVADVELFTSSAVTQASNYLGGGAVGYSTTILGKDAYFGASLGKTALGQKNFGVEMRRYDQGNSLDPAGLIRAAVVYNFFFGVSKRTGSTNGFRVIRSETSIA
jgi:N4-gp56 family major capsid protein